MGRDFLLSGSISSYWIDYLLSVKSSPSINQATQNMFQRMIEQNSYLISSWCEVYQKFVELEQQYVRSHSVLASIPCGYMRDFFSLDFSQSIDIKIFGIDIDRFILNKINNLSSQYGLQNSLTTHCCDALKLPFTDKFDLIASCGLNIYLSDYQSVEELYTNFFRALVPSGTLLLHFLTYPPFFSDASEWKGIKMKEKFKKFDYFLLEHVFKFSFNSTNDVIRQLNIVGFDNVQIVFDSYGISAIAIAQKDRG